MWENNTLIWAEVNKMSLASMETTFKDMDSSALNAKIKLIEVTLFTLSSTGNNKFFGLGTTDCKKDHYRWN